MPNEVPRKEARRLWLNCISCAEASLTQHNRAFAVAEVDVEQAAGLFSGGFLHQGDACGLLHGAVISAGVQAARRFPDDPGRAANAALAAAVGLAEAYPKVTGSADCRKLTEVDFNRVGDRVHYMRSGKAGECGQRSLAWVIEGPAIIAAALAAQERQAATGGRCCVVDAARRIDSLDERDGVRLSGCSGGVGLAGNVCGVLALGVFAIAMRHYRGRRRDSKLTGILQETGFSFGLRKKANRLRMAFEQQFGSRRCAGIVGRRFRDPDDHSQFVAGGGCREVIDFVVDSLSEARAPDPPDGAR